MEKEVTRSSIVNSSLDTLKSSFLDVYYYHTGALAYLREQVDVLGVNNKEEALAIIEGQTVKLQDSLTLVEELIQNVRGIDFESRKLQDQFAASQDTVVIDQSVEVVPEVATEVTTEAVVEESTEIATEAVVEEKEEVAEVATEVTTEAVVEETTEVATEAVVEEKEEVAVPQVVADDSQEEATEPEIDPERAAAAKKEIEESIAATFKDLVGEDRVVKNKDGSMDFSGVLPKEVTSRLNGRRSLADIASAICAIERERTGEAAPLVNDGPVIAVEENSEVATEVVAEEVTEAVVEESTEATTEAVVEIPSVENQVVIPTIAPPAAPEVVSKESVTDEVNAALNEVATEAVVEESTEVTTEAVAEEVVVPVVETEVEEVATEVVADETGLRRFIDGEGQPKAILVSEVQYGKLSDSRVTQEALLKFKHVLPEVGKTAQTSTVSVPDTDSMTDDEKRKTIEVMMADANELYNSGKVDEAQAMYDKISELNKTLVKN